MTWLNHPKQDFWLSSKNINVSGHKSIINNHQVCHWCLRFLRIIIRLRIFWLPLSFSLAYTVLSPLPIKPQKIFGDTFSFEQFSLGNCDRECRTRSSAKSSVYVLDFESKLRMGMFSAHFLCIPFKGICYERYPGTQFPLLLIVSGG